MTLNRHVDLIVVGGGAAGLAAARAAEDAGMRCQLFEAQDQLGGRVRTRVLTTGEVVDEGAQMINGDMQAMLDLAREANETIVPLSKAGIGLCVLEDKFLRFEELIDIDDVHDLLSEQIVRWDSPREILRALHLKLKWWSTPWESVGEAKRGVQHLLDLPDSPKNSLAGALRALLLEEEEHVLARSYFTETFGAALEDLHIQTVREAFERYPSERDDLEFHFAGGMGKVLQHLATGLCHTPKLNAPVSRVRTVDDHVEVITGDQTWTAGAVVVAVPPPAARNITFETEDAGEIAPLLSSFSAGDMIKTTLQFDKAFWRFKGNSGAAVFADVPGLAVVDGSGANPAAASLITFLGGPLARDWAALPADKRQDSLLQNLARVFGEDVLHPRTVTEAIWVDDPWCGGGYNATIRVGGDPDAIGKLASRKGRVRFAGAEVSDRFWGYVEGAIHSGRSTIETLCSDGTLRVGSKPSDIHLESEAGSPT
ncbi:FAD-dependent oxidoreductase [Thalassococcus sp. S3]|uniref:flavin monoamine oxidase family protein n=1 Tax=Thalassococcus sp. S3 TaxID=2017482 RepID=UPI0013EE6E21|nr:FAD-dependent oxidoreductase [Thalassococcus sp. S3]